jgi:hypothetical protein
MRAPRLPAAEILTGVSSSPPAIHPTDVGAGEKSTDVVVLDAKSQPDGSAPADVRSPAAITTRDGRT